MSLAHTTMQAQFMVIGSGAAAFCAAISAARHGVKTVLLLDRLLPTVSGAEGFRLPLVGADGADNRETGLAEEWLLQNLRRAPTHAELLSAQVLLDAAAREENLALLPAITAITMEKEGGRITAFDCWHKASGTEYTVHAAVCADCSAGGIYAAMAGAETVAGGPQVRGDLLLTADHAGEEFPDTAAYGVLPGDRIGRDGERMPFAIPLRCLYARSMDNLLCAGAHISADAALVPALTGEGTAAILGQAVGTAAALCVKYGILPREVSASFAEEFTEMLQYDDCFLPGLRRRVSEAALLAELSCDDAVSGDILNLRTGIDRCHPLYGEGDQGFTMSPGASVEYHMEEPTEVSRVRIVFDSDLNRDDVPAVMMPKALSKVYFLEVETENGWEGVLFENENTRRLVTAAVCRPVTGIRLTVMETWGAPGVHLLAFDFE